MIRSMQDDGSWLVDNLISIIGGEYSKTLMVILDKAGIKSLGELGK